ncbi:MAG: VOC family protein [Phycisphaeraceae bacterium]
MQITQLNHVAIHVDDLDRSVAFYRDVLGLTLMDRPAFDFPGAWFRVGDDQELHLIARPPTDGDAGRSPNERHYAFMVGDADATAEALERAGVEFRGPRARPDGAMQIFLRDPDGHVIELCTTPARR